MPVDGSAYPGGTGGASSGNSTLAGLFGAGYVTGKGLRYTDDMEVHLPPEIETKLVRLAHRRGVDAQALARTAIESFVDSDDWFVREVEKGLAQIDRGE